MSKESLNCGENDSTAHERDFVHDRNFKKILTEILNRIKNAD